MKTTNTIRKNITFFAGTIFLILITAFFVCGTVQSRNAGKTDIDEGHYRVLEAEYVKEVREYLNEQGFENSGVSLTRIVDEQGNRDYSVVLHHKYLEKLTDKDLEALFETIETMAFHVDGCRFQVDLFI